MSTNRTYIAIDLKSFYASVECVERGLDPLITNLVVADTSRTEKTICLAVSPSLKSYKIPGRARLFEVVQRVEEVNADRKSALKNKNFEGKSYNSLLLNNNPYLAVDYIAAKPRMSLYMEYSTRIFDIYLKYIAPEDMHVYSVDEVFMDVTAYLNTYGLTPRELAMKMIHDVLETTGITATAGIGSNMYLCKIAMDIVAKHVKPDEDGVRLAELDEMSYRRLLWNHRPLTDFWRVGAGYTRKLEKAGLMTMGDIARCSLGTEKDYYNEDLLYKMFGVNAELLIDHAWGYEPALISDIKAYKPENNSISSGQVLQCPYDYDKTRLIVKEMTELLVLDLVDKKLVTDQLVLTVGYDVDNLIDPVVRAAYRGEFTIDRYGRAIPKHAHGTANLGKYSTSTRLIMTKMMELYDRIVDPKLLTRRINVCANHVINEKLAKNEHQYEQMDIFSLLDNEVEKEPEKEEQLESEHRIQEAVIDIKKKFGKNAILKGMNLEEGGTTIERNSQIGGHKA